MVSKKRTAWNKGKTGIYSAETIEKIRNTNLGKHHSIESRKKMSESHKGKPSHRKGKQLPIETRDKMRISRLGNKNPMFGTAGAFFGKTHSDETKRKMRLAALERIERTAGQVQPNHNSDACKLIDAYGKKHGYNFLHAENGGEFRVPELGYFVDGYDREKNVVIEYYERKIHFRNGKLNEKDVRRENEIKKHLNCKFIVLTEKSII